MDNIIMVCKHCNSSKRDIDLLFFDFEIKNSEKMFIIKSIIKISKINGSFFIIVPPI